MRKRKVSDNFELKNVQMYSEKSFKACKYETENLKLLWNLC